MTYGDGTERITTCSRLKTDKLAIPPDDAPEEAARAETMKEYRAYTLEIDPSLARSLVCANDDEAIARVKRFCGARYRDLEWGPFVTRLDPEPEDILPRRLNDRRTRRTQDFS